ncbi:hypothetical protein AAY473_024946 [Plecturocebus cupreus]
MYPRLLPLCGSGSGGDFYACVNGHKHKSSHFLPSPTFPVRRLEQALCCTRSWLFPSFRSQFKCHLFREGFQDCPVSLATQHAPASSSLLVTWPSRSSAAPDARPGPSRCSVNAYLVVQVPSSPSSVPQPILSASLKSLLRLWALCPFYLPWSLGWHLALLRQPWDVGKSLASELPNESCRASTLPVLSKYACPALDPLSQVSPCILCLFYQLKEKAFGCQGLKWSPSLPRTAGTWGKSVLGLICKMGMATQVHPKPRAAGGARVMGTFSSLTRRSKPEVFASRTHKIARGAPRSPTSQGAQEERAAVGTAAGRQHRGWVEASARRQCPEGGQEPQPRPPESRRFDSAGCKDWGLVYAPPRLSVCVCERVWRGQRRTLCSGRGQRPGAKLGDCEWQLRADATGKRQPANFPHPEAWGVYTRQPRALTAAPGLGRTQASGRARGDAVQHEKRPPCPASQSLASGGSQPGLAERVKDPPRAASVRAHGPPQAFPERAQRDSPEPRSQAERTMPRSAGHRPGRTAMAAGGRAGRGAPQAGGLLSAPQPGAPARGAPAAHASGLRCLPAASCGAHAARGSPEHGSSAMQPGRSAAPAAPRTEPAAPRSPQPESRPVGAAKPGLE